MIEVEEDLDRPSSRNLSVELFINAGMGLLSETWRQPTVWFFDQAKIETPQQEIAAAFLLSRGNSRRLIQRKVGRVALGILMLLNSGVLSL